MMRKEQAQVRQVTREVAAKFKRVREIYSALYGDYQLHTKNGLKYIAKQLPSTFTLATTRNPLYPIFRFAITPDTHTYLFPLHGEPIAALGKSHSDGEIRRWLDRCGTVEQCLLEVLRKLVCLGEQGQQEVLLECLRVHNGQLEYCYDNWLTPAADIVLENPNELENYYFSQQDLDVLKQVTTLKQQGLSVNQWPVPSKSTVLFRICLMVLHLGSLNLKERNYQLNGWRLQQERIKLRLDYFCSRYNQKGLGDLIRRAISSNNTRQEMEEIWKSCLPQPPRKPLTLSNTNSKLRKKQPTEGSQQDWETPIKHSHINRLNCSMYSQSSNKSKDEDSLSFLHKSTLLNNDENHQPQRRKSLLAQQQEAKSKKNIKLTRNPSKDSQDQRHYQLFSSKSQERLNLKAVLTEASQQPKGNIKLLKYLRLEEYIPNSLYQEKTIQVLGNIHVKSNWQRETYENGSIYLGEMAQGRKEGKGLYLFNSSDFYFGDWANNCMDGYGTYVFTSGEVYEGELKRGFKEGHGRCIYPDGKCYEGFWNKNNKVGLGKVKFPNEVIFIGLFKPASTTTQGLFLGPLGQDSKPLWENKGILEHYHWQKNRLVEKPRERPDQQIRPSASCVDEDGNTYDGGMADGKKEGFGVLETEQYIYQGEWSSDQKFGRGRMYVKNLFEFSGEWQDNMVVRYHYAQQDEM